MALLGPGVLLLAAGASALNQYQERDVDARMERTRLRPLPAGTTAPRTALTVTLVLLASGLLLLTMISIVVTVLGAFAVLWYNGVYTPLKRRTAFAAVPGALVGTVPPSMGWIAGDGGMADTKLFALSMIFFLWQIPHFWLLLMRERGAYERAGLPSLTLLLPQEGLARIVFLWTACVLVACLALPLYGLATSAVVYGSLLVLALWVTVTGLDLLRKDADAAAARAVFRNINIFMAIFMAILSLDSIIGRS
jgi:heme o synthase